MKPKNKEALKKIDWIVGIYFLVIFIMMGFLYGNQIRPEMIPYRLVPSDPHPDYLLEIEIELVHPYTVEAMVEVHRQEVLDIIYERIEFETINPNGRNQIFEIDNKLYYLIRIPYTGVPWDYNRGWE